MSPKPKNNLSRPAKPTVASFKTSKGSEYTVDGASTVRNKSYHAEHGAADTGVKPKSSRTVYIGADAQSDVAYAVGQLDRGASVKMEGDELVVRYNYGRADKPRQMEKRFPVGHTPEKGMAPVEFWDDKKSVHVGNEITEITTHSPPAGPTSMAKRRNPLSPLARPGRPTTTDLMPGEGGFVETDSPSLQRSVPSPITNKERQELVEAVARGKTRKIRAEAAERLKTVLALEAEGLVPHFAQSGQNVLDSERAALNDIESRSLSRQAAKNVGASMPIGAGDLAAGGNVLASERAGLKAVEARTAARVAAKGAGAAGVAADVAGGTISAGALAAMTNKGGTISKSALTSLAKATGKSVGFLTKAAGVLGWVGLAYTLYENTIGRRNDARQQEATALADVGMNGLAQAPQYGDAAYGRLLPGLASGSEAVASASDRTEFNNAVSLDSLLRQNQGALQQAAQVTPVSFEEFMLRVKAEMAARGG